ncbi:methyltransferase domain-containing protein [Natronomonas sp. F2-12]|uniref:Type II methyltransferase n=1 Tax=Natronomonas aquatica TaxID=2841590 RepID=A0A9R1D7V1_9EURY|nr:DNA methyltransferase [Natronomonas aquatica]MCQ4334765.1 methyltransferase domain-containing protein [Natronomonas aquatica]
MSTELDELGYPSPDQSHTYEFYEADARDIPLDDNTVDLVVTSPPYYQKRDYGFDEQIGQETSVDAFVSELVEAMQEWKRVLRPHGSIILNIGDTYERRSLVGVPWKLAEAARDGGWLVRNEIMWIKNGGMPEPAQNRLAQRHENIFHFTPSNEYYYDLHGYSHAFGNGANPGDVWEFGFDRNTGGHLAPFPEELVERCLTMACPPAVCTECGKPLERKLRRTDKLDPERPQAKRAMEKYEQSDLTKEHIRAIQSAGITDAGKAKEIQDGTGRNTDEVQKLADEAKEVLGGYYREFTFAKKETAGWEPQCDCNAGTEPGTVLDPFCGSGTVLDVATRLGFSSRGTDLDPPDDFQMSLEAAAKNK